MYRQRRGISGLGRSWANPIIRLPTDTRVVPRDTLIGYSFKAKSAMVRGMPPAFAYWATTSQRSIDRLITQSQYRFVPQAGLAKDKVDRSVRMPKTQTSHNEMCEEITGILKHDYQIPNDFFERDVMKMRPADRLKYMMEKGLVDRRFKNKPIIQGLKAQGTLQELLKDQISKNRLLYSDDLMASFRATSLALSAQVPLENYINQEEEEELTKRATIRLRRKIDSFPVGIKELWEQYKMGVAFLDWKDKDFSRISQIPSKDIRDEVFMMNLIAPLSNIAARRNAISTTPEVISLGNVVLIGVGGVVVILTELEIRELIKHLRCRFNVVNCLYWEGDITTSPRSYMIAQKFIDSLMSTVRSVGSIAYSVPRSLDCLFHLRAMEEHGSFVDRIYRDNILQAMIEDLNLENVERLKAMEWYRELHSLDLVTMHELCFANKVFCAPIIDTNKGLEKHKEKVKTLREVNEGALRLVVGQFNKLFAEGFLEKHSAYPPMEIPDEEHFNRLRLAVERRQKIHQVALDEGGGDMTLGEWYQVRILPCLQYNINFHSLHKSSDKTISPMKSEFSSPITDDNAHLLYSRAPAHLKKRICNHLKGHTKEDDVISLYEDFSQLNYMRCPNHITKLCAKEIEQKSSGRYFGCMTEPMRRIIDGFNDNIKKVMKYFPQQLNIAPLAHKRTVLYSTSGAKGGGEGFKMITIGFDFDGWNQRMTHSNMSELGSRLDSIFGVTHIKGMHQVLEHTSNWYVERGATRHWDHQHGGIEGQMQYFWTLFTISLVEASLSTQGLRGNVYSCGDNVIARVRISNETIRREFGGSLEEAAQRTKLRCIELVNQVGHLSKESETFVSDCIAPLLRETYVNKTKMPLSLKSCAIISPETSSAIPTLDGILGSISSSTKSSIDAGAYLVGAYMTGGLHYHDTCLRYTDCHSETGFHTMTDEEIAAMMVMGFDFGLPGFTTVAECISTGVSDPYTLKIGVMQQMVRRNSIFKTPMEKICLIPVVLEDHFEQLLGFPYAVPLNKGYRSSTLIKGSIRSWAVEYCEDSTFKALLETSSRENKQRIVESLKKISPVHPKLLAELYDCTPCAIAEKFLSKVESPSTALCLVGTNKRKFYRVVDKVIALDINNLKSASCSVQFGPSDFSGKPKEAFFRNALNEDPYSIVYQARERIFGEGAGIITEHCPFHIMRMEESAYREEREDDTNYFTTIRATEPICSIPSHSSVFCDDGGEFFAGYSTSEAVESKSLLDLPSGMTFNAGKRLIQLYAWLDFPKGELQKLIKGILESLCMNVDFQEVKSVVKRGRGTINHRLRCRGFDPEMRPSSYNQLGTNYYFDSNTFKLFRETGNDYNVNFLLHKVTEVACLPLRNTLCAELTGSRSWFPSCLNFYWDGSGIEHYSEVEYKCSNLGNYPSKFYKLPKGLEGKLEKMTIEEAICTGAKQSNDLEELHCLAYLEHAGRCKLIDTLNREGITGADIISDSKAYSATRILNLGKTMRATGMEKVLNDMAALTKEDGDDDITLRGNLNVSNVLASSVSESLRICGMQLYAMIPENEGGKVRTITEITELMLALNIKRTFLFEYCSEIIAAKLTHIVNDFLTRGLEQPIRGNESLSPYLLCKRLIPILAIRAKQIENMECVEPVTFIAGDNEADKVQNFRRAIHANRSVCMKQLWGKANVMRYILFPRSKGGLEHIAWSRMVNRGADVAYDLLYSALLVNFGVKSTKIVKETQVLFDVNSTLMRIQSTIDSDQWLEEVTRKTHKSVVGEISPAHNRVTEELRRLILTRNCDNDPLGKRKVRKGFLSLPLYMSSFKSVRFALNGFINFIERINEEYSVKYHIKTLSDIREDLKSMRMVALKDLELRDQDTQKDFIERLAYNLHDKNIISRDIIRRSREVAKANIASLLMSGEVQQASNPSCIIEHYGFSYDNTETRAVYHESSHVSIGSSHSMLKSVIEEKNIYWPPEELKEAIIETLPEAPIDQACELLFKNSCHRHFRLDYVTSGQSSKCQEVIDSLDARILITQSAKILRCLTLGDGKGGMTSALGRLNDNVVVSNMRYTKDLSHDPLVIWKEDSIIRNQIMGHLIRCEEKTSNGDIFNNDLFVSLQRRCKQMMGYFGVIACDAEPEVGLGYPSRQLVMMKMLCILVRNSFSLLEIGGTLIVRHLLTRDSLTAYIMQLVTLSFKDVAIIKPSTSNPWSREVYIVMSGMKRPSSKVTIRLQEVEESIIGEGAETSLQSFMHESAHDDILYWMNDVEEMLERSRNTATNYIVKLVGNKGKPSCDCPESMPTLPTGFFTAMVRSLSVLGADGVVQFIIHAHETEQLPENEIADFLVEIGKQRLEYTESSHKSKERAYIGTDLSLEKCTKGEEFFEMLVELNKIAIESNLAQAKIYCSKNGMYLPLDVLLSYRIALIYYTSGLLFKNKLDSNVRVGVNVLMQIPLKTVAISLRNVVKSTKKYIPGDAILDREGEKIDIKEIVLEDVFTSSICLGNAKISIADILEEIWRWVGVMYAVYSVKPPETFDSINEFKELAENERQPEHVPITASVDCDECDLELVRITVEQAATLASKTVLIKQRID